MKKLLLLLLLPLQLMAQPLDPATENYIDSIANTIIKPNGPGGVLLIAQDGKAIYRKAFGLSNVELQVPAKPEHLFSIASVSKQFTAVAILQLARQGKLSLTDDIRKHLRDYNTHGRKITIEQLLTHVNGISSTERSYPGEFYYKTGFATNDELMRYIMEPDLLFEPGTNWSYNNNSFRLAAMIVEKVSNQSFADYLKINIFDPCGMSNTLQGKDQSPVNGLVTGHIRTPDGKWRGQLMRWSRFKGAGGIISCVDDMLKWDIALRENKILPKEWIEKAWKPATLSNGISTNYGYGWRVNIYHGFRMIAHGGTGIGFRSNSTHIPEKGFYIIFSTFFDNDPDALVKMVLNKLLKIPYPVSKGKLTFTASDYTGVYAVDRPTTRIAKQLSDKPFYAYVTASRDSLFMRITASQKSYLQPLEKDLFIWSGTEEPLIFFERKNNKVTTMVQTESVWKYGPDSRCVKTSLPLPDEIRPVAVPAGLLKDYAGTYYHLKTDAFQVLVHEGGRLFLKVAGFRRELIPVSSNKFVQKGIEDISFEFTPIPEKKSYKLIITGLRTITYIKVE